MVLLWVNNHFNDFEMQPEMTDFLEKFEQLLEKEVSCRTDAGERDKLQNSC